MESQRLEEDLEDAPRKPAGRPDHGRPLTLATLSWTFAKSVLFSAVIVLVVLGMAELVTQRTDASSVATQR